MACPRGKRQFTSASRLLKWLKHLRKNLLCQFSVNHQEDSWVSCFETSQQFNPSQQFKKLFFFVDYSDAISLISLVVWSPFVCFSIGREAWILEGNQIIVKQICSFAAHSTPVRPTLCLWVGLNQRERLGGFIAPFREDLGLWEQQTPPPLCLQ